MAEPAQPKRRADARRNRQALLDSAARVFARAGAEASLNQIAREAGLGIGTLFRHFATRAELVEATFRNELRRICDAAPELLAVQAPPAATSEWMERFLDYMTTKHGMVDTLQAMMTTGSPLYEETLGRLTDAVRGLIEAGVSSGDFRSDVDPSDALAQLGGIAYMAGQPGRRDQARRMIDLLVRGLRASA
ncbi:MAG: TetR/AcrR family transcriptional regulator [Propionibacteriaceae bacterium]|jgi:AcrR family transcriptional regulator|nr:TetR/AcrR family transcriptional regulator [Propionibacteriaceae bacterium]